MTAHAGERPAVADHAGSLVQLEFARGVRVHKIRRVAGGLQACDIFAVTSLTTERVLDLAVANQTIRHLRKRRMRYLVGFFQASMTCLAAIARIQVAANVAGRLQIVVLINRQCQQRRHIAHLQMQGVAESGDAEVAGAVRGRGRNLGFPMAFQADFLSGQEVVLNARAGCGRWMTALALEFQLEMQPMRKRRGCPQRGTRAAPREHYLKQSQAAGYPW